MVGGGAAPRGRRDHAARPRGTRPAPPERYADEVGDYDLPRPPSFNEADISDKSSNLTSHRAVAQRGDDRAAGDATTKAGWARCWRSTIRSASWFETLRRHGRARQHPDRLHLRQRLAPGRAPDHRRQVPALRRIAAGAAGHARPRGPEGQDDLAAGRKRRLGADPGRRRERKGRAQDGRHLAVAGASQPQRDSRAARSGSRRPSRCSKATFR